MEGAQLAMSQAVLEEVVVTARQRAEHHKELDDGASLTGEDIQKQALQRWDFPDSLQV